MPLPRLALVALVAAVVLAGCAAPSPTQTTALNAPSASLRADVYDADPGQPFHFSAAGSSSPGARVATYAWDFGDGSRAAGRDLREVTHAYALPGVYAVTLTVTDDASPPRAATSTVMVGVRDRQALAGSVAAGAPDVAAQDWTAAFRVRDGARVIHLRLTAAPFDEAAQVSVRLLDPSGQQVWQDLRVVGGATAFEAVVGGGLAPGDWSVAASSVRGGASLSGEAVVDYGPGAPAA